MGEVIRLCGDYYKDLNFRKLFGFFVLGENDFFRFKFRFSNMMSKVRGCIILVFLRKLSLNEFFGDFGFFGIFLLLLMFSLCFKILSIFIFLGYFSFGFFYYLCD